MRTQYDIPEEGSQEPSDLSRQLAGHLCHLFAPLLIVLDQHLDRRLVRTFLATLGVIIQFRNRAQGLLLSELGAFLVSPAQAPAGTKRLSNLLRSSKWGSDLLARFLWQRADEALSHLETQSKQALCIWDGSVWEKAESEKLEGLCSVRSSKARRIRKCQPGLFNQLSGPPIVVRGLEWTGVLLAGLKDVPTVVAMQWWSRKGPFATTSREVEETLLQRLAGLWGERVLHVAGSRLCQSHLVTGAAGSRSALCHSLEKRPCGSH